VVIGWTETEGARPFLGALLLGYYDPDGRLTYAGRVGTGINQAELARLWRRLQPLAVAKMPLDVPPPRSTRFGSPLVLSRVHWAKPELVAEVKFLTWTEDNLLRQVVYEGLRKDKPAAEVRRDVPHPKAGAAKKMIGRCRRGRAPSGKRKRHVGGHDALLFESSVVGEPHSAGAGSRHNKRPAKPRVPTRPSRLAVSAALVENSATCFPRSTSGAPPP
jgi:hypothetical protein